MVIQDFSAHFTAARPKSHGGSLVHTMIDLHVHTNMSDGSLSPAEVVRRSAEKGLQAIAITDHDTVAGHC